MRDTLMMVGNGLAIDYRSQFQQMPNPSCPLDFPLLTPQTNGKLLRATFAELWQTINNLRAEKPMLDDFSLIKCIRLMPWPSNPAHSQSRSGYAKSFELYHTRALIETQLRLHLTHAYTYFTQKLTELELQKWRWYPWLLHNRNHLHTIVSFNYDLLVEKAV